MLRLSPFADNTEVPKSKISALFVELISSARAAELTSVSVKLSDKASNFFEVSDGPKNVLLLLSAPRAVAVYSRTLKVTNSFSKAAASKLEIEETANPTSPKTPSSPFSNSKVPLDRRMLLSIGK